MKRDKIYYSVIKLYTFLFLFMLGVSARSQSPNLVWQRSYGGSGQDWGRKIIKANSISSSTYVIAGETTSSDGDISSSLGGKDIYMISIDSVGGILNRHIYGGSDDDIFSAIAPAWSTGYILVGSTKSNDIQVSGNHGQSDLWVINVNNQGVLQWQKCFGGTNDDHGYSITKTADSSYVISGRTASFDGDISLNHGLPNTNDFWLIKIDINGNLVWEVTYGGLNDEYALNVIQTSDHGFLLSGGTFSNSGQVSGNNGSLDYWIVKTDSIGNLLWQKCFGGSSLDEANVSFELNGCFYIQGTNNSNDGDVSNNHTSSGSPSGDAWLVCIDSIGLLLWERSLGGSYGELGGDLIYSDGYLFVGGSASSNDGDVTNPHFLSKDYWILQMDLQGNILWQYCYGGSAADNLQSIIIDDSNLYAFGHSLSTNGDVSGNHGGVDSWLVKLNIDGLLINTVEYLNTKSLSFFPNPTRGFLTFTRVSTFEFLLLDIRGKIVKHIKMEGRQNIDLSEISNGLYFIQPISSQTQLSNHYLIISH